MSDGDTHDRLAEGQRRRARLQQLRHAHRPRRDRRPWWTPRSTPASTSSTPPTSTAGPRARPTWARRSVPAGTRSCWPPSSAPPTRATRAGPRPPTSAPPSRTASPDSAPIASTSTSCTSPIQKTPIAETIGALVELVAEGKVREFGCSNFNVDMLDGGRRGDAGRQPGLRQRAEPVQHPATASPRTASWSGATAPGVAFLPFFPLASGLLSGKYRAGRAAARRAPAWPPWATARRASSPTSASPPWRTSTSWPSARATACSTSPSAGCCARPAVASVIAGATRPEQITANVAAGHLAPGRRRAGGGRHHRAALSRDGYGTARTAACGPGADAPSRPHRRQVDQQVVGDERDGEVHRHEHQHGLRRLPLMPDVDVRQPEDERHHDGQAEEQPPRRGADPRHDRPRRAGDEHADDGQLGVVVELEVPVALGRGEQPRPDGHQRGVGRQRQRDGEDRGQDHPPPLRRPVRRGEVDAGPGQGPLGHIGGGRHTPRLRTAVAPPDQPRGGFGRRPLILAAQPRCRCSCITAASTI